MYSSAVYSRYRLCDVYNIYNIVGLASWTTTQKWNNNFSDVSLSKMDLNLIILLSLVAYLVFGIFIASLHQNNRGNALHFNDFLSRNRQIKHR